jgi:putative transposase
VPLQSACSRLSDVAHALGVPRSHSCERPAPAAALANPEQSSPSPLATRDFPQQTRTISSVESRRRLPHIYPENRWLFLTWHLHGSLPRAAFPPAHKLSAGQAFVWMDRYVDRATSGPTFLRQEAIAHLVATSLFKGVELGHYKLEAFVVMSNHVHALLLPLVHPSRLLQSLKGFTGHQANKILERKGEPFWQRETYDHWVRDDQELRRIAAYIEENPVKAGLVSNACEYPWSSANGVWRERMASVHTSVNAAR